MSASSDSRATLALAASLVAALGACDGGGSDDRAAPLWEVRYEGRSSLLLGTMHDVVDADELPPRIWEELSRASTLTTEADVRFILRDEFLTAITLPEGQTLSGTLSDADWQAVVDALDVLFATPEDFDRLQPWYLEGSLVRTLAPTADDPIDTTLVDEAMGARVRLEFLETWQDQVSMLNGLGLEHGLRTLLRTVNDPEGAAAAHLAWAEAYRRGDIERLEELAFAPEDVEATPEYYETVVFARSEAWLPALEERLRAGGALIAVGFMHMPTDRGLAHLLEARGYDVAFARR